MKVLILGSNGQLGTDLQKNNPGHELVTLRRADGDITDRSRMKELIDQHAPEVVINTAAFHRTEECEEKTEEAFRGNVLGPRLLAEICAERRARLIQYSSDYVFDGKKRLPYRESDAPGPLSVYGVTKLGGEYVVQAASPRHIVIRTASLFGTAGSAGKGGNFVETMVRRGKAGNPTEVVDDIIMSPTYTLDLAAMTWTMLEKRVPGGVYHVANRGTCSWFEFARKIFTLLGLKTPLKGIRSADRPSKMRRPAFSALASERFPDLGIPFPRVWQDATYAYLEEKGHLAPKSS